MADFAVAPERTALVNVDVQNCFVESAPDGLKVIGTINRLAAACRDAGILVIHTRHVLRPDGSNMGVLGELVPKVRAGLLNAGAESAEFHSSLVIEAADVLLEKPRFGAFHGTDLELILRSRGIDTIIVSGISTPVCCDTTAREANARDFRVFVVSDGTASTGSEAAQFHAAALAVLGAVFARVVTVDEVLEQIRQRTTTEVSAP